MHRKRLPITRPAVAVAFIASFLGCAYWLTAAYDWVSLRQDPVVLFQWLGLSYLAAFSVAELVRRRALDSIALIVCALGFLLIDLSRHGGIILQRFPPPQQEPLLLAGFSTTFCAVSADTGHPFCPATTFLATNTEAATLVLIAVVVLALLWQIFLAFKWPSLWGEDG